MGADNLTTMFRRLLILILLGTLALAACDRDSGSTTTTVVGGSTVTTGTTIPGETTTTSEMPPITAPDLSDVDLPDVLRDQLADLMVKAQEIRGLPFLETPTITVLDDAAFRVRIQEMLNEGMEDIPADQALYRILGLLKPEDNLRTMLLDLYGEQVAGFYDGREREVVVPARSTGFTLLQQGTMVHELVHALTDQHFEFDPIRDEMVEQERYDEATALRALIEGDASLAEVFWFQSLTPREQGQYIGEALSVDQSTLDTVPSFIRESLIFPYDSGTAFVFDLHNRGGWAAINDAYRTIPELPGSTEQIITPDDFGRDLPIEVPPIPVDLPGYQVVTTSVWGELGFRLMFNQVLGESQSLRASDGWGGDFYHQWFNGVHAALLLVYKGDTPTDVEEMRSALLDYHRAAIPAGAFTWVAVRDDRLFFILAGDPEVGAFLRTEMGLDED